MYLRKIDIKNFRLLKDVSLSLEEQTTVIVGRNNSGKTSLAEIFRRLLSDGAPNFKLEDFHISVHEKFWEAFSLKQGNSEKDRIRESLPVIEVKLTLTYNQISGILSKFIIELDPACRDVVVIIRYQLTDGQIDAFLGNIDLTSEATENGRKAKFFRIIKERIPTYFTYVVITEAPNDPANQKVLERADLRDLIQSGFINAQRGLDDTTYKEHDVLGKIIGRLFCAAMSDLANQDDHNIAQALEDRIQHIQREINTDFETQLKRLMPAFDLFGYPGLPDPKLGTETQVNAQNLLDNNTKIHYISAYGIHLPETYNGLGARNLIFILLKLWEFFKSFMTMKPQPDVCMVFIEEPEAHLHPQMQEVFVSKLSEIAGVFAKIYRCAPWPVQFVVTTHSSHIANRASFEAMRYFLAVPESVNNDICQTRIKDLKKGFSTIPHADKNFLYQYMTLTRCDLLFADKAILIEGTSERLLMPRMLEKVDSDLNDPAKKLTSQYISVMEVGGAYAHIFFELLDFLELRTLIITDLDSIDGNREACKVTEGVRTSNACITTWFGDPNVAPANLISKSHADKTRNIRRIAYQVPENADSPCGRSFEDAFMWANPNLFDIDQIPSVDRERVVWEKVRRVKKSDFALKYAIQTTEWIVPLYIKDGLVWLAEI